MKRIVLFLLLIAALFPMAAFRLSAQTTGSATAYVQFSGCGRAVLYAPGEGTATAPTVAKATAPAGAGYKWTLTFTYTDADTTVVLKNDAGLYLRYADGAATAVSDEASATTFRWNLNTYCTDTNQYTSAKLVRHQLLLPGSATQALGVRNGKLQAVNANSRYAVVYLPETKVDGPDLPVLTEESVLTYHYYNLGFHWLGESGYGYVATQADDPQVHPVGSGSDATAQWLLVETGDNGNFYLRNKAGYYMKQTSASTHYSITQNVGEATEFQLVEAVDQAEVKYNKGNETVSGATWADFWQLRNAKLGYYLYEGGGGKFGGTDNTFNQATWGDTQHGSFCGGSNRMSFIDTKIYSGGRYFQFTGQGRYALYENGGNVSAVDVQTDSIPSDKGYQWSEVQTDNGYRLMSGNGRYLRVSNGTFTATQTADDATAFDINFSTYYTETIRFNLQPVGSTQALGVDESGKLAMVNANSRYAAVASIDYVKGPDRILLNTQAYTMSTFWNKGFTNCIIYPSSTSVLTTAPVQDGKYVPEAHTAASFANGSYQWRAVAVNDGSGDFRLCALFKYDVEVWLTQSASTSGCSVTTDSTKASVFRLYDAAEQRDSIFVNFWQLKNVDTDNNTFLFYGYGNQIGGTSNSVPENAANGMANGKGKYNNYNNRFEFVKAQPDTTSVFVYFSALGTVPLCDHSDAAGADAVPSAHQNLAYTDDRSARWRFEPYGNRVKLRSANGRYITYTDADGFGTTVDSALAYRFAKVVNSYENNGNVRAQLLNSDRTKALSVVYNGTPQDEYVLTWAEPGTRYSTLRNFVMLNSPVYPLYTTKGSKRHAYRIYTNQSYTANNFSSPLVIKDGSTSTSADQPLATDSLTTHRAATYVVQDHANDFWYFRPYDADNDNGDVVLISYDGRHLAYDDTNARCYTTTDATKSARVRLVECDGKYQNWQIEIVSDTHTTDNVVYYNDGTFTLGAPNKDAGYLVLEAVDLEPTFYELQGGLLRFLQFIYETDKPHIANGTKSAEGVTTVTGTTTSSIYQRCWKNVGADDNFVLENADGTYLAYDTESATFTTAADTASAAHFALFPNTHEGTYVTWCLVLLTKDADGNYAPPTTDAQCIVRNADGSLALGAYSDVIGSAASAVYFSTQVTVNFSNGHSSQYYFVTLTSHTDQYLTDNTNGAYDARGTEKILSTTPAESAHEPSNSQLWSFIGTNTDFVMMSRDSVYLCWNKDPEASPHRFTTTLDSTVAAHFAVEGTDADLADNAFYVRLTSSEYAEDGDVGQYLYYFYDNNSLQLGLTAEKTDRIRVEHWDYTASEDYTNYEILSKRSIFVHRVQSETQTLPDAVIQPDTSYGYTKNPYTGKSEQATNVYTVHHYVKDGTSRMLYIPSTVKTQDWGSTGYNMYQRFYNYETGEAVSPYRVIFTQSSRRRYRNGTVMGYYLNLNGQTSGAWVMQGFTFQMPIESETNYRYTVALDMSRYTDFVDYFGDNSTAYSTAINASGVTLPTNSNLVEPTIGQRALFVIHNAREMADSMRLCVEGNTADRWVESHTIAFPKKKVNFKDCTVPFDLELQNYWFYTSRAAYTKHDIEHANADLQNVIGYSSLAFEVDAATNTAGINVETYAIDGAAYLGADLSQKRFLTFKYPKLGTDGNGIKGDYAASSDMGMALGDSAVVKVYAVVKADDGTAAIRYQLAKFTLLFQDQTEPRSATDILGYDEADTTAFKSERAPLALEKNYGTARARIRFNFTNYSTYKTPPFGTSNIFNGGDNPADKSPSAEVANTFAYPVKYAYSSYAFEPNNAGSAVNRWGSYTLSKYYKSTPSIAAAYHTAYPDSTRFANYANSAFLYIDASEETGQIVSLAYNGNLCRGSRMFFSAWITSPNRITRDEAPANVLFTVKGVYTDAAGTEQSDELYTYCPGPIYSQARRTDGTTQEGTDLLCNWQQVYFTFVNNGAHTYNRYELAVDNACTSSQGGDILIDDIAMYALSPSVSLERTTPVCGEQVTLAKLTTDFNGMLTALGLEENVVPEAGNPYMWYCILDKNVYDAALAAYARPTTAQVRAAFNKALIGDPNSTDVATRAFRSVQFSTFYDQLPEFDYKNILGGNLTQGVITRETGADGTHRMIISDKISGSNLRGNHQYYLVFVPRYANSPITAANAAQEFQAGDDCCIISPFVTAASVTFMDNGDENTAVDDTVRVCSNQNVNISGKLNGVNTTTGAVVTKTPMYDWWLDYAYCPLDEAYLNGDDLVQRTDKVAHTGDISVREALENFRHHYPTATTIGDQEAKPTDAHYPLTETNIRALASLTKSVNDVWNNAGDELVVKGHPALLHLYSQSLNVAIEGDAGECRSLTLIPIETETADTIVYCYDPQNVNILISGKAPTMLIGFRDRQGQYPASYKDIGVRVNRTFLTSTESGVVSANVSTLPTQMLRLPLRNIAVISTAAIGLKRVTDNGLTYAPLYLVGTNDDNCPVYETTGDAVQFRTVGRIYDIKATDPDNLDASNSLLPRPDAYVDLFLTSDFKPREGYYYQMRIDFQEEFASGHEKTEEEKAVCDGSLVFTFKVVPDNVKWTGGTTGEDSNPDWSNDGHWMRADATDLHDDTYTTNEANGTHKGYVPLASTNVIIPEVDPEVYYSPYVQPRTNNHDEKSFIQFASDDIDDISPVAQTWTSNIQYDITPYTATSGTTTPVTNDDGTTDASTAVYPCMPFYTNTCRDIYFAAGGQALYTENLQYRRAYFEYPLTAGRWYTLSSPLSRMLSGDWYAPSAEAAENTTLFASRTFSTATDNRFSPAVYQRGWDKGKATLYYLSATDASTTVKSENVAMRADWSPVYNDVDASYTAGGFSLKVGTKGTASRTYADALFRLPKHDTSFDYYTIDGDGSYDKNTTPAARTATDGTDLTARLKTDSLANDDAAFTQTLTAATAASRIFLAGNPFPCGLNMDFFFEANPQLEKRYWLYTANGQTAAIRDEARSSWITTGSAADPGILPPGQGFFVETKEDATELELTFYSELQDDAAYGTSSRVLNRPIAASATASAAKGRGVRAASAAASNAEAASDVVPVPTLYIEAFSGDEAAMFKAQHEKPSVTAQHEKPSVTAQHEKPSVTAQHEKPSVTAQHEKPSVTAQHEKPSVTAQHENPSVTASATAIVRQAPEAANGYRKSEDLIALLNSATADCPTVYTLADSAAVSINTLRRLQRVPLGITSADSLVTLRISGMASFPQTLTLLDEQTATLHPLTLCGADTATVTLPGNTLGRYFILGATTADADDPADELLDLRPLVSATSGTLHVSGAEGGLLTRVTVTDPAGRQLYRLAPFTPTLTLPLPHGAYIVRAANTRAERTVKVEL